MQPANTLTVAPMVFAGLGIARCIALTAKAQSKNGNLVFQAPLLIRALIAVAICSPLFCLFAPDFTLLLSVIAILISVAATFAWPPTFISKEAMEYLIWWKPTSVISWGDIVDIERYPTGDLSIYTTDGSLSFSKFLADGARFETEVLRRAKLKKASAPEAVTTLHLS